MQTSVFVVLALCVGAASAMPSDIREAPWHSNIPPREDANCAFCEVVGVEIEGFIFAGQTNYTQIQQYLDVWCHAMPWASKDMCSKMDNYAETVFHNIYYHHQDPTEACVNAKICERSRLLEKHQAVKVAPVTFVQKCDLCQLVMLAIDRIGYKDEPKLKAELDKDCKKLGWISTACTDFVDTHLDEIVKELNAGTGRFEICAKLKFCNADPFTTPAPKTVAEIKPSGDKFNFKCPLCDIILKVVGEVGYKDEAKIVDGVNKECKLLHENFLVKECTDLADEYIKAIIQEFEDGTAEHLICAKLKMCPASTAVEVADAGPVEFINECEICEVVLLAIDRIGYKDEQKLKAALDKDCHKLLGGIFSSVCTNFVDKNLDKIVAELNAGTGRYEVCAKLHYCDDSPFTTPKPKVESAAVPVNLGSTECFLCDSVLKIVGSIGYDDEDKIVALTKKECGKLPFGLDTECDNLVIEYVKAIITELKDDTAEDLVCAKLKMCPSAAASFITKWRAARVIRQNA